MTFQMPSRLRRAGLRGFSVTEMLTVLALMGLLVAVSAPAMLNFFQSMKVRTAAQRMVSHLRLCRQVAVSRRDNVTMRIEGKAIPSQYLAWEDKVVDQAYDANGADNTVGNDDDEVMVVKADRQLRGDAVEIKDVFYTVTSAETPANSAMNSDMAYLRFYPDGTAVRLDGSSNPVTTDWQVVIRMEGEVAGRYIDRWDVMINRAGKVETHFYRYTP